MTKYIFIPVIKEVFLNNDDIDIDPTVIDKAKVRLFANFLLIKRKLSCADLNKLNKRKIENLWKKVITQKGKSMKWFASTHTFCEIFHRKTGEQSFVRSVRLLLVRNKF